MAPSFFSWLGNGTSRRGFPVMLRGGPSTSRDRCISVADLVDEEDMKADGPARKGRRAVDGLARALLSVAG